MRTQAKIALVISVLLIMGSIVRGEKINIPPCAFHPANDVEARYLMNDGEYVTGSSALFAPVDLPDGAIIKNMKAMVVDASLGWLDIVLYRINMYTKAKEMIFWVGTHYSPDSSDIRSLIDSSVSPASLRLVNNGACQYYLWYFSGGSNLRLHGITIEYK